jgi:N-sulfoglucosamine sulfohydrolase
MLSRMRRQTCLRLLVAACATACLALDDPATLAREQAPDAARTRLNVVVAIADDWSWPHAGADGDPVVRTPTYDRLAREGVRFTHAYTAAPSCTPSRAALFSGQAPHRLAEGAQL